MAHIDVSGIDYFLSDGTQLLNGVTFKVPDGTKTALIGPNGTGKTTLFRIISGDLVPDEGVIGRSGNMGIMRQFVGQVRDDSTVRDLLVSAAPPALAAAAREVDEAELAMVEHDDEPSPDALRPGHRGLGRRRRLRRRNRLGRGLHGRAGAAV